MSRAPLGQTEFIALVAMLFATIAFSIDAMLPALPGIADELSPEAPNRAQLILTSFVLGMGLGTVVAGPLSDAFGRKPVILWGAVLYVVASGIAWAAQSLEAMLAARVLQGLAAAGPRVVSLAMVRDLYAGRQMARIVSFAMMIFTLFPAFAPLIGQGIIALFGWRAIFGAFVLFALASSGWLWLRQPETLPPERRRPLSVRPLMAALREVLANRIVVMTMSAQALSMGLLFATLSSTQPIFDVTFERAESFPAWFALIALLAGSASFINASLVVRLGMRRIVSVALGGQIGMSGAMLALHLAGLVPEAAGFALFFVWALGVFFMVGLTLGNLNALALEPMGHIAGMASSVVGAFATVGSVLIAAPVGLAFDGTPVPAMAAGLVLSSLAFAIIRALPRREDT